MARPQAPKTQTQHQGSHAHHDTKRKKHNPNRWPVRLGKLFQALDGSVPAVRHDQAAQSGNLNHILHLLFSFVGDAKQQQRCTRSGLVVPLNRSDFHGLVLDRIQAMLVTRQDLQWSHNRNHPHRHRKHFAYSYIRQPVSSLRTLT